MSGGKGKSHGGKAGPKGAADGSRQQVSHSAKAGLQVRKFLLFYMVVVFKLFFFFFSFGMNDDGKDRLKIPQRLLFSTRLSSRLSCSSMAFCWRATAPRAK